MDDKMAGMQNSIPAYPACHSPIFVLTSSRSGSTLLRFILDSHPELACPPETAMASACASLVRAWGTLESAGREDGPPDGSAGLPPAGIAAVQTAIDGLFGAYLQRRGKKRWCDKSLDTHLYADLIAQVYPKAKFICLYRHCMDVIASGTEACPWGLSRFGFDPYVAQYPGNNVAAVGAYWLSCAQQISKFEEEHPDSCHRIRYEDLVTAPEDTVAAMFSFLGVDQVPGITKECFAVPHESNGPGDEKIWFTSEVTSAGIGRGVRVPVAALPPPVLTAINETLVKLDYRPASPEWNEAKGPFDPRAAGPAGPAESTQDGPPPQSTAALRALDERIRTRTEDDLTQFAARWSRLKDQTVALVVDGGGEPAELRWSLASAAGAPAGMEPGGDGSEPAATFVAGPATWDSLLSGQANVVGEMSAGRLRCINKRDTYRLRSEELHAVMWLLGLTRIPVERSRTTGADLTG